MAKFHIRFLGVPVIERDGQPVPVDTRKAIALLAYLALTGQRQHRDSLAALFWPEGAASSSRAALRRTLSSLNTAISGEGLEADRDSIHFELTPSITIDVLEFRKRIAVVDQHQHVDIRLCDDCQTALFEAAQIFHDEFMAGFTLRDSPDFDIWQYIQAEKLRQQRISGLERLVHGYAVRKNYETAIEYALRWLTVDPLHEAAHQELMQLFAWMGDRARALRQYRECVRILDQELGVPPLEDTIRLYEAIQEGRTPPLQVGAPPAPLAIASAATTPRSVLALSVPMVGRTREWDRLTELMAAMQSRSQLTIIEGEAGIGKTRLVDAFAHHLAGKNVRVLRAQCYEGESGLAFTPFIQAIRGMLRQPTQAWLHDIPSHWLSEVARIVPELTELRPDIAPVAELAGPAAESRFFEGIVQALFAILRGADAGLFLLEDAHWLDSASLDLLSYMLRRMDDAPWCTLLTWRTEDVPRWHRLRKLAGGAPRAVKVTTIQLDRLNEDEVHELLEGVSLPHGILNEDISRRLYRESEGLPFFVVEYLALLAEGDQVSVDSQWMLPASARDLLQSRLSSVSEMGWQMLSTAAVIGRLFDFEMLRTVSGRSDEETVTALEELLSRSLIREVDTNEGRINYDFYHDKLRILVQEETSLARRRLLHERIGDALSEQARRNVDGDSLTSQIAHHYKEAGRGSDAASAYVQAGNYARSLIAYREAITHFQAALALGHPDSALLHEAIGDLHTLQGDYDLALRSFEAAAALSLASNVGHLEHRLGVLYQRLGEWDLADSHLEAALETLPEDDQASRARVWADRSLAVFQAGDPRRAETLAAIALEEANHADDQPALAQAHNILGILARHRQAFAEASQHLTSSLEIARALNDSSVCAAALNNLALILKTDGQLHEAIDRANQALDFCRQAGDRHREAALLNNLADLYYAAGDADASMAHLEQAVVIFAQIGVEADTQRPEIWKLREW